MLSQLLFDVFFCFLNPCGLLFLPTVFAFVLHCFLPIAVLTHPFCVLEPIDFACVLPLFSQLLFWAHCFCFWGPIEFCSVSGNIYSSQIL